MIATQSHAVGHAVTRSAAPTSPSTLPTIAALDTALERSITLATAHDLEVLRSRRRASDGVKVYTVSSFSDPSTTHDVELRRGVLHCDCAAAHFRPTSPCAHCTCVYMQLVVDLYRRERVTRLIGAHLAEGQRHGDEEISKEPLSSARSFGPPSPDAPMLADDTRGFSLYK